MILPEIMSYFLFIFVNDFLLNMIDQDANIY